MMIFALSVLATIMPPFAAITVMGALFRRVNHNGALVGLVLGGSGALTLAVLSNLGLLKPIADIDMIFRAAVTFVFTATTAWLTSGIVRYLERTDPSVAADTSPGIANGEVDISLNLTPRVIRMMIILLLGISGVTMIWTYYFRGH
jgi:hypothetical protein